MAGDVLDWISQISSILGLWTFVGIVTFIILFWRKIYYVSGLIGTIFTTTLSLTTRYIAIEYSSHHQLCTLTLSCSNKIQGVRVA